MDDKCGEPGCPGGHDDLRTQHCNRDQLVAGDRWPVGVDPAEFTQVSSVEVVYAVKRNENCPKCGHRSFFRRCKCGGVLW